MPRSKPHEVTTKRIDPALYARALKLADGDRSRVVVHSPTNIEVLPAKN